MTTTYNGWTNYETWLVNLWMDNEQGSQEFFAEQAKELHRAARADAYNTKEQRARHDFADWLKDFHEENAPATTGVYGDLINAALCEVNWDEIARHYIEDLEDDDEVS